MKYYLIILSLLFLSGFYISSDFARDLTKNEEFSLRTYALKINVPDMKKAVSFYVNTLGFEIEDKRDYPNAVVLKSDDRVKLILYKVKEIRAINLADTGISFTLQVNDLDKAIEKMKAANVKFAEKERRTEGVGFAISILDPSGRSISLMHQTIVKVEPFKEPKIYNFGYSVPDMNIAREFYAKKLGFVVRSEKYLPLDLPLGHKDNSFGFMLHVRPNVNSIKSEYPKKMPLYTVVFEADNLQETLDALLSKEIKIIDKKQSKDGMLQSVIFEDPFGNISEIVGAK